MSVEEEKVDDINDEGMHYDREDENVRRAIRYNSGTGVEQSKPSMEGKSYKGVSKQLLFIMKNDQCMKKQIKETNNESEVMNNKNAHAYMQAAVNVMFMQMNEKKGIKLFGKRDILEMIKQFKQRDKGSMPGEPAVIPLKPDKLTYAESRQALEPANLIKEK